MITLIDINDKEVQVDEGQLIDTAIRDLCQQVLTTGQREARREAFERAAAIIRHVMRSSMDGGGTLYGDSSYRDVFALAIKKIEQEAQQ